VHLKPLGHLSGAGRSLASDGVRRVKDFDGYAVVFLPSPPLGSEDLGLLSLELLVGEEALFLQIRELSELSRDVLAPRCA
jgi:hypothetical protein